MENVIKTECKETCPNVGGWYDTNEGNLYWNTTKEAWSCRSDRVSEEYPEWWLKADTRTSSLNLKNISGLLPTLMVEVSAGIYLKYNDELNLSLANCDDMVEFIFKEYLF
jgi:hypothetical protein